MKNKKITITYQATEPKEWIYTVKRYYKDGKVDERVTASIGSLLEWFFDDLDYRRTAAGDFVPCWEQRIYNLKRSHRWIGDERIDKVEIEANPLYV